MKATVYVKDNRTIWMVHNKVTTVKCDRKNVRIYFENGLHAVYHASRVLVVVEE